MIGIGAAGILVYFVTIMLVLTILPMIFFLIHLMNLLNKCAPENRTMEGGMVWLNLIPLFNLGWIFYTIIQIRDSLQAEFSARGIISDDTTFAFNIGLAYAICTCCTIIPVLGILSAIGALVLFIIYWVQTYKYSKLLD